MSKILGGRTWVVFTWLSFLGLLHIVSLDRLDLVVHADPYNVAAIEPPTGRDYSRAYGINNLGQVVGRFFNQDASQAEVDRQAFIWDPASGATILPTLGGDSEPWGINDSGLVSGFSFNASGHQRAVRWDSVGGSLLELGTLANPTTGEYGDSSTAYELNNLGQVTGYARVPNEAGSFMPFHAILYDDVAGLQDLGTFDTASPEYQFGFSISYDTNDNQQVVGLAHSGDWEYRPFLYDSSNGMQELPRDPAHGTGEWYAVTINDSGWMGGHVIIAPNQSIPYYWTGPSAAPVALPMPAAFPYGEIYAMNASGEMVGIMWNSNGLEHAFIFDVTAGLRDLNDQLSNGAGWVLHFARDINDSGQIVGSGALNGELRGFVLSPDPSASMGQISGTVTNLNTSMPLEAVTVRLFDETGAWVGEAQTTAVGSYSFPLVIPGTYFVSTANAAGFVDEVFDDIPCSGCDPTIGVPVVVAVGSTALVDFELLNPYQPSATLYENAEHGTTEGWQIYDNDPPGASIQNVYDAARQSRVIELSGAGTANGFRLQNPDGSPWHNSHQFLLEWSMAFTAAFTIYIDVESTAGHRFMVYTPVSGDSLGGQEYVHHGLGPSAIDGHWHTFVRDLQADLWDAQPGVTLLEVNGFYIRGAGRLDDIHLRTGLPVEVYADAEDGTTKGWWVYDNDPPGAVIQNVYDSERQSRVIALSGSGTANGYRLGNRDGSPWHSGQSILEWSMAFSENFSVYVDVETTAGHRYMVYTPVNADSLGGGEYIHHGLGTTATDGHWHTYMRDLQADIDDAQPGVTLLEVNGLLLRGSGRVDDVKLQSTMPAVVCNDAEDGGTNGWWVYDNDPPGATIQNLYDDQRGSRVIELIGSGTTNGYRLGNPDRSPWHNNAQLVLEWSMAYYENFSIYVDVETTAGHRYFVYTPVNGDSLGGGEYVHHGLGTSAMDGDWHTYVRDLRADLEDAQPGAILLEVNGFLIRGSGRVDDVKLWTRMPRVVYEDAEDGATGAWWVYDNDPPGATIQNVYDDQRQSQVVELLGAGTANGFRLGNADGSFWHNPSQFTLEWSMAYSEAFVVYIDLQTTAGRRYLCYRPLDVSRLGSAEYIHHGLGSDADDGRWRTFIRDLQSDVDEAQPGARILEVNGFLIRGSGRLDDIELRDN